MDYISLSNVGGIVTISLDYDIKEHQESVACPSGDGYFCCTFGLGGGAYGKDTLEEISYISGGPLFSKVSFQLSTDHILDYMGHCVLYGGFDCK